MVISIEKMILNSNCKYNYYIRKNIDLISYQDFQTRNSKLFSFGIANIYKILSDIVLEGNKIETITNFGRVKYLTPKNGEFIIITKGRGFIANTSVEAGDIYYINTTINYENEGALVFSRNPI